MTFDTSYLKEMGEKYGLALNDTQIKQFEDYYYLLIEWNEKINLTAITDPKEVVIKHFIDSMLLCRYGTVTKENSVADIGSGAGFPAIPVAIYTGCSVTMIDSLNKRVIFLNEVIQKLGLTNCTAVHFRGEEYGTKHKQSFDVVTARAVAPMRELTEYCLPMVKVGGYFYAMKGPDPKIETDEAKKAIKVMGGQLSEIKEYSLEDMGRSVISIKKLMPTPPPYPRPSAKIAKKPII